MQSRNRFYLPHRQSNLLSPPGNLPAREHVRRHYHIIDQLQQLDDALHLLHQPSQSFLARLHLSAIVIVHQLRWTAIAQKQTVLLVLLQRHRIQNREALLTVRTHVALCVSVLIHLLLNLLDNAMHAVLDSVDSAAEVDKVVRLVHGALLTLFVLLPRMSVVEPPLKRQLRKTNKKNKNWWQARERKRGCLWCVWHTR